MGKIRYLVMDVDGTLTDGKIYMGNDGEIGKAFDIKDGCGIFSLLPKNDIIPVVITARNSKIVENRCQELKINEFYQGVSNKLEKLKEIVGDSLDRVAYAGDDLPDIPCMEAVKKVGGVVVCPADAIPEIRAIADYVSGFNSGQGAIRDCINYILQKEAIDVEGKVRRVIDCITKGEYSDGIIDGNPYVIQDYYSKEESQCIIESHRKHIDVQCVLEGCEEFLIYMTEGLTSRGDYDSKNDSDFWQNGIIASRSLLKPGSVVVVYCGQPHKGAILHEKSERIKKIVCKIAI